LRKDKNEGLAKVWEQCSPNSVTIYTLDVKVGYQPRAWCISKDDTSSTMKDESWRGTRAMRNSQNILTTYQ